MRRRQGKRDNRDQPKSDRRRRSRPGDGAAPAAELPERASRRRRDARSERDFRVRRRRSLRLAHRFRRASLGRQCCAVLEVPDTASHRQRPRLCPARRSAGWASAIRCGHAFRHPGRRRTAFPIRCSMRCGRRRNRRRCIGSKTPAAGSRDPMASRARPRRRAGDRRAPGRGAAARLSVALRRPHRRDEPLAHDGGARSHPRRGDQAALVLRLHAGRDRQSRPHQRGLRLQHRRRGDRRDRRTHPLAAARQGPSRTVFRQQVRRDPEQLHARRHAGRGRPPAGQRPRRRRADLGRPGRGDGDHRRRDGAAPRPQCQRSAGARAGFARQRQGQAARVVPGLPAQSGARRPAPGERPRHRRDREGAQRPAHLPGLRAGGGDRLAPSRPSTSA